MNNKFLTQNSNVRFLFVREPILISWVQYFQYYFSRPIKLSIFCTLAIIRNNRKKQWAKYWPWGKPRSTSVQKLWTSLILILCFLLVMKEWISFSGDLSIRSWRCKQWKAFDRLVKYVSYAQHSHATPYIF